MRFFTFGAKASNPASQLHFAVILTFSLVFTALGACSVGTDYWFEQTDHRVEGSRATTTQWGLFHVCIDDKCTVITGYADYRCPSGAVRKGSDMKSRVDVVKSFMLVGLSLGTLSSGAAVMSILYARRAYWWVLVVSFAISLVLYSHTIDYWY